MNSNSIVLTIDTASNGEVCVGIEIGGKEEMMRRTLDRQKAQVVLPMIQELLHKNALLFTDLTAIQVTVGPGSFTGLRVGVSIANTLGVYLQIPVNDNPIGTIVTPQYS